MKNILIVLYLLLFAVISGVFGQTAQFTQSDRNDLIYLYEEDKLAHDFYVEMEKKWGHHSFSNIIKAERRHMSMIKEEAEKIGVNNISVSDDGKFVNEDLQGMFDELIVKGNMSLLNALKSAAFIEETDINDLELRMTLTDIESLEDLYSRLISASENHLNAFVRNIRKEGGEYVPQVLNQERFDAGITKSMAKKNIKSKNCCDSKSSSKKISAVLLRNQILNVHQKKTTKNCKGKESS